MRKWVGIQVNFCHVLAPDSSTLCVLTYLIHLQPYGVESIITNTSTLNVRKLRHSKTEQCAQGHARLVSGQAGLRTLHSSLLHYVTLRDEWVQAHNKGLLCPHVSFPSMIWPLHINDDCCCWVFGFKVWEKSGRAWLNTLFLFLPQTSKLYILCKGHGLLRSC